MKELVGMREIFKLEYRGVYIQVPVDENFLESVDQIIDWLSFFKTHIKQHKQRAKK